MDWRLIMRCFIILWSLCFLGCASFEKQSALNWVTPDRIGAGVSNGTLNAHGKGNKIIPNQEQPLDMDIDGTTYSTSIWFEWDLVPWKEEPDYDQYLRERIKTLRLEKILLQKEEGEG